MTNLTEYLTRLREVEGKATSGPWIADGGEWDVRLSAVSPSGVQCIFGNVERQEQGDLIALLRNEFKTMSKIIEMQNEALESIADNKIGCTAWSCRCDRAARHDLSRITALLEERK